MTTLFVALLLVLGSASRWSVRGADWGSLDGSPRGIAHGAAGPAATCVRSKRLNEPHSTSRSSLRAAKRRVRGVCVCLCLSFVAACGAEHKLVTARRTPCRFDDIKIFDEVYAGGEETWQATCGSAVYRCSAKADGNRVRYACRRADGPAPRAES